MANNCHNLLEKLYVPSTVNTQINIVLLLFWANWVVAPEPLLLFKVGITCLVFGMLVGYCGQLAVVRATNSKLLGTKILEVSKNFRVELENT